MVMESEVIVDDGVVLLSSLITSKIWNGKQLTLLGNEQELVETLILHTIILHKWSKQSKHSKIKDIKKGNNFFAKL